MDLAGASEAARSVRDWQGLVEELEKGIAVERRERSQSCLPSAARAGSRGEVPPGRQGAEALPGRVQAESGAARSAAKQARAIYWDLGKLNMVQKLLELELKRMQDGHDASDASPRARRRALRSRRLRQGDADVRARSAASERPEHRGSARASRTCRSTERLVAGPRGVARFATRTKHRAVRPRRACSCAPRASRVASRPTRSKGLLAHAYAADPSQHAGRGALRGRARRGGSARGDPRAAASGRSRRARDPRKRARGRVPLRHALGPAPPERRARREASSRRRSSSIPRTKRLPRILRERLGNQRGRLGSRAQSLDEAQSQRARTARRHSCSRRRARSRGVSSAT